MFTIQYQETSDGRPRDFFAHAPRTRHPNEVSSRSKRTSFWHHRPQLARQNFASHNPLSDIPLLSCDYYCACAKKSPGLPSLQETSIRYQDHHFRTPYTITDLYILSRSSVKEHVINMIVTLITYVMMKENLIGVYY
ncbi:hypothetical protein EAG_14366 [Camponotus floridanus]|uniref:Uncharacterized protein n=1 Tax=Camponotus floridanus TaxID=104421 RepID=E2A309_CAMFO|nr:hypothetical protein EAG_14366 [Camponotus floridanus]